MKSEILVLATAILIFTSLSTAALDFRTENPINFYSSQDLNDNDVYNLSQIINEGSVNLDFNDNGDVSLPQGNLDLENGELNIYNGLRIDENGVIRSQRSDGDINIELGSSSTGELNLENSENQEILRALEEGKVIVPRGNIDLRNNRIKNLSAPVRGTDAANYAWVDTNFVNRSGDTLNGSLNLNSYEIRNSVTDADLRSFSTGNTEDLQYLYIATLPASDSGSNDEVHVSLRGQDWGSNVAKANFMFKRRNSFKYRWSNRGNWYTDMVNIVGFEQSDGTVDIYLQTGPKPFVSGGVKAYLMRANNDKEDSDDESKVLGAVEIDDSLSTSVPSGTVVFNSSDTDSYPPNSRYGIGSLNVNTGDVQIQEGNLDLSNGDINVKRSSTDSNWFTLGRGGATKWNIYPDGTDVDALTFEDDGASGEVLKLERNGGVQILNGNLKLNGNNIEGVGKVDFTSGLSIEGDLNTSGGNIDTEGGNIALNGGYLSNDGDNEGITVNNNGNVEVPSGNLVVSGTTDSVDLDNPGNAITLNGNQYLISSGDIGSSEIGSNAVNADELASDAVTSSGGELDSSVAGNQLNLNSGSLEVVEGSGSDLNADLLDGVQLGNVDWGDVAMERSDVSPSEVDLSTLSTGSGLSGSNYDGTTARTWSVDWNAANDLDSSGNVVDFDQAADLDQSGEITDGAVGNSDIASGAVTNNEVSFNTLDVSGGSAGDGSQSGLTVDSNGNLYISGSLNFPGDVNTVDQQELDGSFIPSQGSSFNIGSSSTKWKNGYFSGEINTGGIDVNGVSGSASSDGSKGIGAPSVYTNIVEAQNEKGGASTYIELGSGGYHSGVEADHIGFVTQGEVQAMINDNGNLDMKSNSIKNVDWSNSDNPNTDSQDLSVGSDPSGGGQTTIDITNGNSATFTDDYAADDQNLGTNGNQITLDNGGSVTAPYADNADQLNGLNRGEIAQGRRTFDITSSSGTEYFKIATLTDGTGNYDDFRFTGYIVGAMDQGQEDSASMKKMVAGGRDTNRQIYSYVYGDQASNEDADFLVTYSNPSSGVNEYHLYVRVEDFNEGKVVVERAQFRSGQFSYQSGLSQSDLTGSVIHDTETDATFEVGDNLNMNSNAITDVDWANSDQPPGSTDDQTLSEVLGSGNSAGGNNVDLNGNNLTSSNGEICAGDLC